MLSRDPKPTLERTLGVKEACPQSTCVTYVKPAITRVKESEQTAGEGDGDAEKHWAGPSFPYSYLAALGGLQCLGRTCLLSPSFSSSPVLTSQIFYLHGT